MVPDPKRWRIGLLGYGEVGRVLAEDLRAQGLTVAAHDRLVDTTPEMRAHAAVYGVKLVASVASVTSISNVVISIASAADAVEVAEAARFGLRPGTTFIDLSLASPAARQVAAAAIEGIGARYIEGAVTASTPPCLIQVSLAISGADVAELTAPFQALGFSVTDGSSGSGVDRAVTICRTFLVHGLETLISARFTTAPNRILNIMKETQ